MKELSPKLRDALLIVSLEGSEGETDFVVRNVDKRLLNFLADASFVASKGSACNPTIQIFTISDWEKFYTQFHVDDNETKLCYKQKNFEHLNLIENKIYTYNEKLSDK